MCNAVKCRGHFGRVRKMFQFRALDEDTAAFDQPEDGQPAYEVCNSVSECICWSSLPLRP